MKILSTKDLSFENYQKKYKHELKRNSLLRYTKKEVSAFENKHNDKELNKNHTNTKLLEGHNWLLCKDTYYEIPKVSFKGKVITTLSVALIIGAGAGASVGLLLNNKSNPSFESDIEVAKEINEKIDKSQIKTTNDFVDNYGDLSLIEPKNQDDEFAFDVKNKEVVIVSKSTNEITYTSNETKKSNVFRFKNEYKIDTTTTPSVDSYSTYLTSSYTGERSFEFNTGIDVGSNKDMKLTCIVNQNNISNEEYIPMVVTNYGTLTINGSLNSISHYGVLSTLTVESIDGEYNEYGTIKGNVVLKAGTFKAQENSSVNTIIIENTGVKIEVDDKSDTGSIVATKKEYLDEAEIKISEEKREEVVQKEPIPTPEEGDLGGLGTEKSPYVITDLLTQAYKITEKYNNYAYFKYVGSEKEVDCSNWAYTGKSVCLNGQLDCNNVTLNNLNCSFIEILGAASGEDVAKENKISNLTINANINQSKATGAVVRSCGVHAELKNITVHGSVLAGGASAFVGFGANNVVEPAVTDMFLTFDNCFADVDLVCTAGDRGNNGSFIHYPYCNPATSLITIKDSLFTGTSSYPNLSRLSNSYVRYVGSGPQGYVRVKTEYSESFISKYGNPEGTLYEAPKNKDGDKCFYVGTAIPTQFSEYKCDDQYLDNSKIFKIDYEFKGNIDQATNETQLAPFLTTKKATAVYAVAALYVSPNGKNGSGSYLKSFLDEVIDISSLQEDEEFETSNVKNYRIRVNKEGISEEGINGYEYDIYDNKKVYYEPKTGETLDPKEYNGAYVSIAQFDNDWGLVCIDHFDLIKPAA